MDGLTKILVEKYFETWINGNYLWTRAILLILMLIAVLGALTSLGLLIFSTTEWWWKLFIGSTVVYLIIARIHHVWMDAKVQEFILETRKKK